MLYPENIPDSMLASHASDGMLLFTAVLSVIIGVVLTLLGIKGRVLWLFVWSQGLILSGAALGLYLLI